MNLEGNSVIYLNFVLKFISSGHLQESKVLKFLGFMWNPLSWVMEAAAIMAIALANGGVSFFLLSNKVSIFVCIFCFSFCKNGNFCATLCFSLSFLINYSRVFM